MQLTAISPKDWGSVFRLMEKENFPDTPELFAEACSAFAEVHMYGLINQYNTLFCIFIMGEECDTHTGFIDVVCDSDYHGRWATKGLLRELWQIIFNQLGWHYVWAQPQNTKALKTCLQAGFKPIVMPQAALPLCVLSAANSPVYQHKSYNH